MTTDHRTAAAIRDALVSPNEADSNGEPANVVDGLYRVARSLSSISHGDSRGPTGLEALCMAIGGTGSPGRDDGLTGAIRDGLADVADALRDVAAAIDGKQR